ncbi:hypothetical protein ZIOFF_070915 [Zingiber officinale]|uniref:Uncharacterized protein n=1 Tax=Zingiber officinale TaxID=94328 RepID=A0A8J5BDT8_ZINOF|nr:hypothetical protein ZIOFF_070915 [Zingiber officinale]
MAGDLDTVRALAREWKNYSLLPIERKEAIMKLEQALEVDPKRHATVFILGNAHSQQGFFNPNEQVALGCLDKATQCFEHAMKLVTLFLKRDPANFFLLKMVIIFCSLTSLIRYIPDVTRSNNQGKL